jgi:hyperosmotically inducible periplasmic protein
MMENGINSRKFSLSRIAAAATVSLTLCAALMLVGCNQTHPDEKDAVNNALTANSLGVVSVSEDRDKGVMTLTGDVETVDKKQQAEMVAKQAAPDYTISNQVGVRPIGMESQAKSVDSDLDSGIEDNCKAAIKAHKRLDEQSISCSAKNGTLTLTGSVNNASEKKEAGQLAKKVPNVKELVNEIEVKSGNGE